MASWSRRTSSRPPDETAAIPLRFIASTASSFPSARYSPVREILAGDEEDSNSCNPESDTDSCRLERRRLSPARDRRATSHVRSVRANRQRAPCAAGNPSKTQQCRHYLTSQHSEIETAAGWDLVLPMVETSAA